MRISLSCIQEDKPGAKWQEVFLKTWPFYEKWFLIEGVSAREGYATSAHMLETHMPELLPIYNSLTELAGGGDLVSRYLSMYCPPPYITGCTQLAWIKNQSIALIRNYDYNPRLFEGVMLYSNWLKPIIGVSDCNWGLLDGLNAEGLSASLTFGGRKVIGKGFGVPLIIRYILETCSTVNEGIEKLKMVPVHMAYNVTLVDQFSNYATIYVSPDRELIVSKDIVGTNHQQIVEWKDYAALTFSMERLKYLYKSMENEMQTEQEALSLFFQPPLYVSNYENKYVTLYTSIYKPVERRMEIMWPGRTISQSFTNFVEQKVTIDNFVGKQI